MGHLHANGPLSDYPASYYAALTPPDAPRAALPGSTRADLAIVGAGFTGLTAALYAAQAGLSVVVLEAARVGWGASGRNGGQIGAGFNWDQRKIIRFRGSTVGRALWNESIEARETVKALIATHAPEAAFRPGILQVTRSARTYAEYRKYGDWLEIVYGHKSEMLDRDAVAACIGTTAFKGGALDSEAGYCNPLAFCLGLARAAEAAGAMIHEGTEVSHITPSDDLWTVTTPAGEVVAKYVLHACNGLGPGLVSAAARRVWPLNNYIAVTAPLATPPMTHPMAVADDRSVVNYFWQSADGRLVYGGGESYGKKFPSNIEARVRENLVRVYPNLGEVAFDYAWGGTLAVTATRLPYVGHPQPGLYTAGGYSGHGLALAPHAGRAVVEAILGAPDRLDLLGQLPVPVLPGGRWIGGLATTAGMAWGAWRDRRAQQD